MKANLAFPTLLDAIMFVFIFVVGVALVYLLSKALKIFPKPIAIVEPRKEAALAIIVAVALFVLFFAFWTVANIFNLGEPVTVDLTYVALIAIVNVVGFMIVFVALKSTQQELGTMGINKNDLGKMVALGLVLGVIFLTVSGLLSSYMGGGFAGFSFSLIYALIFSTIVGFSEELFYRGYIQTRLSAYGGSIKGLVATSLLFAFTHFSRDYYYYGNSGDVFADVFVALSWASIRVFPSFLLGYIMLKSQNMLPSAIFHTFWDWSGYLWRLS